VLPERDDRNTFHVFGEYADVYDIRQAVEDKATRPLYYESRIGKLPMDEEGVRVAEEELDQAAGADASGRGRRPDPRTAGSARRRSGTNRNDWHPSSCRAGSSAAPRWKARRWWSP
jgi:SWI2/SNF2 ATPase-like protein